MKDRARLCAAAVVAVATAFASLAVHADPQALKRARGLLAAGNAKQAYEELSPLQDPLSGQPEFDYLLAIQARKRQTQPGWTGFGELGLGYDSNIPGVPGDFGAAAQQAFNLTGIEATGNSIKRGAAFANGAIGAEYSKPLSRGWSLYAGGEAKGRAYRGEPDFNSAGAEARFGGALNSGPNQWRASASYFMFNQDGDAPGDPTPSNDRRMAGVAFDWRHALDPKTQAGVAVQVNSIRFPENRIEDFDQVFVSASWLKSFERKGVPLLYLTAFASDDRAPNKFADANTTKSKNLAGLRSYLQYSINPKLQLFNALGLIHRRDKDSFARSTQVEKGRDTYGEATIGASWQFRERCALRLQYAFSHNSSNIDLYDFNRHEVSSTIRCEML